MRLSIVILGFFLMFSLPGMAQVTGLWKVVKVRTGQSESVPHAEWIKIQDNAKFSSGIGYLQNRKGIWSITGYELTIMADDETPDTLPPYTVSYPGNFMKWERMEGAQKVEYFFERITELPMGIIDKAKGKWNLVYKYSGPFDRTAEMLVKGPCHLDIFWDGHFDFNHPKGEYHNGRYWFDYENSTLVLYSEDNKLDVKSFKISFDGEYLILSRESEEMKFKRLS